MLRRSFVSARSALACFEQDLYVGLSPYSAPGIFSLLAATEITDGVWYPVARTPSDLLIAHASHPKRAPRFNPRQCNPICFLPLNAPAPPLSHTHPHTSQGGFQKVRDAIENIVTNFGVQIRKETAVEQILLEQPEAAASSGGGAAARPRAVGVRLASGEVVNADVVVANPDLPQVYNYMLEGALPFGTRCCRLPRGSGAPLSPA